MRETREQYSDRVQAAVREAVEAGDDDAVVRILETAAQRDPALAAAIGSKVVADSLKRQKGQK